MAARRKPATTNGKRACDSTWYRDRRAFQIPVREARIGGEFDNGSGDGTGEVARAAGVGRLVLTHLSTRYDREFETLAAKSAAAALRTTISRAGP